MFFEKLFTIDETKILNLFYERLDIDYNVNIFNSKNKDLKCVNYTNVENLYFNCDNNIKIFHNENIFTNIQDEIYNDNVIKFWNLTVKFINEYNSNKILEKLNEKIDSKPEDKKIYTSINEFNLYYDMLQEERWDKERYGQSFAGKVLYDQGVKKKYLIV